MGTTSSFDNINNNLPENKLVKKAEDNVYTNRPNVNNCGIIPYDHNNQITNNTVPNPGVVAADTKG